MLVWNVLLAVMWALLYGEVSLANLIAGFVLGFIVLVFIEWSGVLGDTHYFRQTRRAIGFAAFFLYELVFSNLKVAAHVLSRKPSIRPGILAVDLIDCSDAEVALLSNLVCLTPGTLVIDVSHHKCTMYVHTLDVGENPEIAKAQMRDGFERQVKELFEK
jgi:multicomponent Na+:H+ antiporter subunit E